MSDRPIPIPALVLGWAGVLPFAALAGAAVTTTDWPVAPDRLLVAYGAAILSFMGGVQWGVAMRGPGETRWIGYAASVVPALLAWIAWLLPARSALTVQPIAFALLFAYDIWTVRQEWAPRWYARLRLELTFAVIVCLSIAAIFGR